MNKPKTAWRISLMELGRLLRSTKIVILALFAIFINVQVIAPLRALSEDMGHKLSALEPFAAVGNSGLVVLVLPLFFITLMADFPMEGEGRYFYQIRCSRRTWAFGQLLYALEASATLVLSVLAATVLLSLDFISLSPDYSYAVTNYAAAFPERAGEYVLELIPENLYSQIPLTAAAAHTALLLVLYFMLLAMLLLVFSLAGRKTAGIFAAVFAVLLGTVACAGRMDYMWAFPMPHTITWLHYSEYERVPVMPLGYSYLYFGTADVLLATVAIAICRRHRGA